MQAYIMKSQGSDGASQPTPQGIQADSLGAEKNEICNQ